MDPSSHPEGMEFLSDVPDMVLSQSEGLVSVSVSTTDVVQPASPPSLPKETSILGIVFDMTLSSRSSSSDDEVDSVAITLPDFSSSEFDGSLLSPLPPPILDVSMSPIPKDEEIADNVFLSQEKDQYDEERPLTPDCSGKEGFMETRSKSPLTTSEDEDGSFITAEEDDKDDDKDPIGNLLLLNDLLSDEDEDETEEDMFSDDASEVDSDLEAIFGNSSDEDDVVKVCTQLSSLSTDAAKNKVARGSCGGVETEAVVKEMSLALPGAFGDGCSSVAVNPRDEYGQGSDSGEPQLKDIFNILIPDEITSLIFKRLPIKDLRNARSVCKRWTTLVDPLVSFSPYLFDYGTEEVKQFAEKGYDIYQLSVSMLLSYQYPDEGLGFGKIKILNFLPYRCSERNKHGVSHRNLENLMKELETKSVERISLHSMSFNEVKIPSPLSYCSLPNLVEIEISTLEHDGPGFDVCMDSMKNYFPALVKFTLCMMYERDGLHDQPPYYKDIYSFIGRHYKTLREVSVDFTSIKDPHPVALTIDHNISEDTFTKIRADLSNVKLRHMTFAVSSFEGRERFVFAQTVMDYQCCLTSLTIHNIDRWNRLIFVNIQECIERCSTTLKKVSVRGCLCGFEENFNCRFVQNCHNLKHLAISVCGITIDSVRHLPNQVEFLNLGKELSLEFIEHIIINMKQLKTWALVQGRRRDYTPLNPGSPPVGLELFKKILTEMTNLDNLILHRTKSTKPNPDLPKIMQLIIETEGLGWRKCGIAEEKDVNPKCTFFVQVNRETFPGFLSSTANQ